MVKTIEIEGKKIGKGHPVFIIAEAGVNHEGSLETAKKLIDAAADAGCDMVKFQTFSADKIVIKKQEMVAYQKKYLKEEQSYYDMLKGLELDYEGHKMLMEHARRRNIIFQSTSHSNKWSIDLLESLGVTSHKLGSPEITNFPHIQYTARTGKPILFSTGTATMQMLEEAVLVLKQEGNSQVALMHCTSNYPCNYDEVNLKAMHVHARYGYPYGYSDHTKGLIVPYLAVFEGAVVIEKHFTLDRGLVDAKSPDHKLSLEPDEMALMVKGIRFLEKYRARFTTIEDAVKAMKSEGIDFSADYAEHGLQRTVEMIMGDGEKKPNPSELIIGPQVRKSLIATRTIRKGERFCEGNMDILRPEGGLHPRYWNLMLEKGYACQDLAPEDFITADKVEFKHDK